MADAPEPFLAEDFARIAGLISKVLNDENARVFQAVLANNIDIILAALRLAPVGLAAVAYHDLGARKPLDLNALRDGWQALERAVAEWRAAQ